MDELRNFKAKTRKMIRDENMFLSSSIIVLKELRERYDLWPKVQSNIKAGLGHNPHLSTEISVVLDILHARMEKYGKDNDFFNKYILRNSNIVYQTSAELNAKLDILEHYNLEEFALFDGTSLLISHTKIKEKTLDFLIDMLHYPHFDLNDEQLKDFLTTRSCLLGQNDIDLHRNLSILCVNGLLDESLFSNPKLLKKNLYPFILYAVTKDLKKENVDVTIDNILNYYEALDFDKREDIMRLYPFGQTQIGPVYFMFDRYIKDGETKPVSRIRKA